MVIDAKQTTVAYRCPHCGAGVMSAIGLFSLQADMLKLKCTCGQSEMTMVYSKEGDEAKVRLTVPCMFCPKPHTFTIRSSVFFSKELFVLPCPYTDMNIAFLGDANRVKAELSRSELELLDLLEKNGIKNPDVFRSANEEGGRELPDPEVQNVVLYIVKELDEEGKITCHCSPEEEHDFQAEITEGGVLVTCPRCGCKKLLPTNSYVAAHEFLNLDELHLE